MPDVRAPRRPGPAFSSTPQAGPSGDHHRTSVVERGSFALAHCTCGWKGPARRARDRARRDAHDHAPD